MPFIQLHIHVVWTTKNRKKFLNTFELRQKVWRHIMDNAKKKEIQIDFVNGYKDHCHCLLSLNAKQNLAEVLNLIKGESAHWINKENLTEEKFQWQNDYYAVSISERHLNKVRNYIRHQEEHHKKTDFEEELDVLESYGKT